MPENVGYDPHKQPASAELPDVDIPGPATPDQDGDLIERGTPKTTPETDASVALWTDRVVSAEKYWSPAFDRMRQNMELARLGARSEWYKSDKYTVNLINRHITNKVADLFAKNPTVVVKPKKQIHFVHWDGNMDALTAASRPGATDPASIAEAGALMQDIETGMANIDQLKKISKTLEIVVSYYWKEQKPGLKKLLKKLVRRASVTGIGYVQIGFQRVMEPRPGVASEIADKTRQIQSLRAMAADLHDKKADNVEATTYELEKGVEALQSEPEIIAREGLVHDFPQSTMIIPDPATTDIATWTGTNWLARKYLMTSQRIKEVFKKDIGTNFTKHVEQGAARSSAYYKRLNSSDDYRSDEGMAAVYQIQDRSTGTVRWICDGYPDYLSSPVAPDIMLEQFFDIYALTFNDIESEKHVFPLSDVDFMRHPQAEFNRSRQGAREHRQANRPGQVALSGAMSENDRKTFGDREAFQVIELEAVGQSNKVEDLLQAIPTVGIDPALYETHSAMQDIQLSVGSQEARFGATSGATATEVAIADQSASKGIISDVDELDTLLSDLAEAGAQICLEHLSENTVKKIAGRGAIWPQFTASEIFEQLHVSVQAGSSGRPNKAADMAMIERILPTLMQMPGLDPNWIFKMVMDRFDAGIDADAALASGVPSIAAMNAAAGGANASVNGGGATPEANAQGVEGATNAPVGGPSPGAAGRNASSFPDPGQSLPGAQGPAGTA